MPSRAASVAVVSLLLAAFAVGCQSPWQTASPGHGGGDGWFNWLGRSERTGGQDPLARLAGGGEYGPGDADADRAADQSRKALYADRTGEMNLSREGAQRPATTTFEQAVPTDGDDATSRLVRSLQQRRSESPSDPVIAATGSTTTSQFPDAAVAPAGHQETMPSTSPPAISAPTTSRSYVDTAPPSAASNPFYDPFGAGQSVAPADYRQSSTSSSGVRTASTSGPTTGSNGVVSGGGSALRLLSTPTEQEPQPQSSAIAYPSGGSSSGGSGSLLKLLGDNPLRKDGAASPPAGGDYVP